VKLSRQWIVLIVVLGCCMAASAATKDKEKEHEGQTVDSGTFGVFMGGRRVGTETFAVYQNANGSVIKSEFKTVNAPTEAVQTSEMQLSAGGEIRRYEWKELSPGKGQSVVLPNDQFLTEKWSASPQDKEQEQPYLLPASTSILDDYFFIHREILAWKFLGFACKQDKGQAPQCPLKQRAQMGTLNPRQHSSAPMSAEYLGRETIQFKGSPKEFNKVEFKNDGGTWQLWLDDQFKLMKVSIGGDNTEVIRD